MAIGGHGQGLRAIGQVLLQLVVDWSAGADRSITHNLAYKPIVFTESSMQNRRTGLQNSRPVCDCKCFFGCVGHHL